MRCIDWTVKWFRIPAKQPAPNSSILKTPKEKQLGEQTRPSLIQPSLSCHPAAMGHPEGWVTRWTEEKPRGTDGGKAQTSLSPSLCSGENHSSLNVDVLYWVTSILMAWLLELDCGGFEQRQLNKHDVWALICVTGGVVHSVAKWLNQFAWPDYREFV